MKLIECQEGIRVRVTKITRQGSSISIIRFDGTILGRTATGKINLKDEHGKLRRVEPGRCQQLYSPQATPALPTGEPAINQ